MNNCIRIIKLPAEKWKGKIVPISTINDSYYDFKIFRNDVDEFSLIIKKTPAEKAIVHTAVEYNFPVSLYQDQWLNAEAYGVVGDDNSLMACVEMCPEKGTNRLLVTTLWVSEEIRGIGIGKKLIDRAKKLQRCKVGVLSLLMCSHTMPKQLHFICMRGLN